MRIHPDLISRKSLARLSSGDRLDQICDYFESQWRNNLRPDFTAFLELCENAERPSLFTELILVDRELRIRSNETLSWDDYVSRYPEFAELIETVRFREVQTQKAAKTVGTEVPTRISHFQLLKKVGSGASGNVWKAFDERLRRTVAVKISREGDLSERNVGRFLREAQAHSKLRHPGIVSVFQADRTDDAVFIISDFIDGNDLRKQLSITSPTFKQAAVWTGQIARALHYAHCQGVIHRDIKPANILIDHGRNATITDFGLAKQIKCRSSLSLANHILGTPAYMSPEQARGHGRDADGRSDIYSLGVVLYEMIVGRVPFEGDFETVINHVLTKDPLRPRLVDPKIPRDLELICCKCIEKQPERRYMTALDVAEDIERFLKGEAIQSRPYRIVEMAIRRFKGRIKAVAVVAAICAVVFFLARKSVEPPPPHSAALPVAVSIDTIPSQSKVTFVPLGDDGEPIAGNAITPTGHTPVEASLVPGDYLVEARSVDGHFQEVLRHVPRGQQLVEFKQDHYRWTSAKDGKIALPSIRIPEIDRRSDMVLVQEFSDNDDQHSSFYIDELPATVADYLKVLPSLPSYLDQKLEPAQPIPLVYHDAVQYAEKAGKRLPTLTEWRAAQAYLPPRNPSEFAEWTATWHRSPTSDEPEGFRETHQVVCGNVEEARPLDAVYSTSQWAIVSRDQKYPKIGLRCVRDVNVRFMPKGPASAAKDASPSE